MIRLSIANNVYFILIENVNVHLQPNHSIYIFDMCRDRSFSEIPKSICKRHSLMNKVTMLEDLGTSVHQSNGREAIILLC